jgi:hypothetical protein
MMSSSTHWNELSIQSTTGYFVLKNLIKNISFCVYVCYGIDITSVCGILCFILLGAQNSKYCVKRQ